MIYNDLCYDITFIFMLWDVVILEVSRNATGPPSSMVAVEQTLRTSISCYCASYIYFHLVKNNAKDFMSQAIQAYSIILIYSITYLSNIEQHHAYNIV
jgi:hypothetical protein